jgi:Leucine-rich repeat (LRR) protein
MVDRNDRLNYSAPSTMLGIRISDNWSVGLFHHFPALQELKISVCPYLMSLPLSMQNLTSLQSLEIYVCNNIAALPDWLGDLSSLKLLIINQCNSIKFLPPCIEQLTKLQKLQIVGNLELKQWCESEEKKKLAHIIQIVSLIINCILTEFSF